MRILMINDYSVPFGGAERSVFETAKLLREKGHEVLVAGGKSGESFFTLFGRFFNPIWYFRTKQIIREFKPDVLHAHGLSRIVSPAPLVAARRMEVPVVMTFHDYHLYCAQSWGVTKGGEMCPGFSARCITGCRGGNGGIFSLVSGLVRYLKGLLHRSVIRRCVQSYICPARSYAQRLAESLRLSREQVFHLPYFVEDAEIPLEKPPTDSKVQFLYIGRLTPEKGCELLVRAVSELVHGMQVTEFHLAIVGSGPTLPALKELSESLQVASYLSFLGSAPPESVGTFYKSAHAIIIPSLWLETGPLVALEAMKYGRAIIGSNLGGIAEIVEPDKTGTLFPPGDDLALARLMKDLISSPERLARWGTEGKNRLISRFGREQFYEGLCTVYDRVIAIELS